MTSQVQLSRRDGWLVLAVAGDFDIELTADVRSQIMPMLDAGNHRLIIDLTATEFMDSTAIGLVVGLSRRVKSYFGELRVVTDSPSLLRLFEITGLIGHLPIYATVDDAVRPVAGARVRAS